MTMDPLAGQVRLLALNAVVAAARGGAADQAATPVERDLRRLTAQLGATATRLSAMAASPHTDAAPGDPGDSGDPGDPGDIDKRR